MGPSKSVSECTNDKDHDKSAGKQQNAGTDDIEKGVQSRMQIKRQEEKGVTKPKNGGNDRGDAHFLDRKIAAISSIERSSTKTKNYAMKTYEKAEEEESSNGEEAHKKGNRDFNQNESNFLDQKVAIASRGENLPMRRTKEREQKVKGRRDGKRAANNASTSNPDQNESNFLEQKVAIASRGERLPRRRIKMRAQQEGEETKVEEELLELTNCSNDEDEDVCNECDTKDDDLPGAFAIEGIANTDTAWDSAHASSSGFMKSKEMSTRRKNTKSAWEPSSSRNLISATVVEDDGVIPAAEAVSEETLKNRRRLIIGCSTLALAMTIIAIVVSIVLSKQDRSEDDTTQSPVPSDFPSAAPSISPTSSVRGFLESIFPESSDAFDVAGSPQYDALQWLELNHTNILLDMPEHRIVQRFALATLFHSLDGTRWVKMKNWLLPTLNECDWIAPQDTSDKYSLNCIEGDIMVDLILPNNRMRGKMPGEIFLLSNLRTLRLNDNFLSGTLPPSMGSMTALTELFLNENLLSGVLPFMGKREENILPNLETFIMGTNFLSGTMPTEIGLSMPKLKRLILRHNFLHGAIPSEISQMTDLEILELGRNSLSGTIPGTLYDMTNLKRIVLENNGLTGTLNTNIGQLQDLGSFDISKCHFSGQIPSELGNLPLLERANFRENHFNGTMPEDVCDAVVPNGALNLLEADCAGQRRLIDCECCHVCCRVDGKCFQIIESPGQPSGAPPLGQSGNRPPGNQPRPPPLASPPLQPPRPPNGPPPPLRHL